LNTFAENRSADLYKEMRRQIMQKKFGTKMAIPENLIEISPGDKQLSAAANEFQFSTVSDEALIFNSFL